MITSVIWSIVVCWCKCWWDTVHKKMSLLYCSLPKIMTSILQGHTRTVDHNNVYCYSNGVLVILPTVQLFLMVVIAVWLRHDRTIDRNQPSTTGGFNSCESLSSLQRNPGYPWLNQVILALVCWLVHHNYWTCVIAILIMAHLHGVQLCG